MTTADSYRALCKAALALASAERDPGTRQAIYQIARSWLDLAEEAASLDGDNLFDGGRAEARAGS